MAGAPILVFEYRAPVVERDVPAHIVKEWEGTLKLARERILNALTRFDATMFASKIADASSDAYEEFVNPAHPKAKMITLKQRVKLAGAYQDWLSGVQEAFAQGGIFEKNVEGKTHKFSAGAKLTLGAVGLKSVYGWGPASKLALLLVGDIRAPRYALPGEQITLGPAYPKNVFGDLARFVVPPIVAGLTMGTVYLLYSKRAGWVGAEDIVRTVNTALGKIATLAQPNAVVIRVGYSQETGDIFVYGKAETLGG